MDEFINLLPRDRIKRLKREYYFRLGSVALCLASVVLIAHAIFLIPTYFFLSEEIATRKAHLAVLVHSGSPTTLNSKDRRAEVTAALQTLSQLTRMPHLSASVEALLSVPRPSITLDSITINAATGTASSMQISGLSSDRESLREFHDALTRLPNVSSVDLPLSVYATENHIPFTISITGSLSP